MNAKESEKLLDAIINGTYEADPYAESLTPRNDEAYHSNSLNQMCNLAGELELENALMLAWLKDHYEREEGAGKTDRPDYIHLGKLIAFCES